MPKSKSSLEQKIALAALKLAAKNPWPSLTLAQIAKAAKISLSQTKKLFRDTSAILPTIVVYVDEKLTQSVGKPDSKASPHDRLFEVMMARFDVLQSHRKAIVSILQYSRSHPEIFCQLVRPEWHAMQHMLQLAGISEKNAFSTAQTCGLLAIYGLALCRWMQDDTADMSRTMSVLDRSLTHAGSLADLLSNRCK